MLLRLCAKPFVWTALRLSLEQPPPLDQLRNPIIRAMEDTPFKAFKGVEIERLV